ncbi:MAG: ABC transporter permease, partial [Nitrososphaerales archaeon]
MTGRIDLSETKFFLSRMKKNPVLMAGAVIGGGVIIIALISNFIVNPELANTVSLSSQLCWGNHYIYWGSASSYCPGNTFYWLGTDLFGRGVLSMIILALPLDLEIAFSVVICSALIGLVLGGVIAYVGGRLDLVFLRITDIFLAFPTILFVLVVAAIVGPSILLLTLAILVVWWPKYLRLGRAQILSEKDKNYVEALKCMGSADSRILFLHLIPNTISPILVQATLDIGGVILTFSSLMFLGFSPKPNLPELGTLVSQGIENVFAAPWLVIFPGLAIFLIAFSFNMMGDTLRDLTDP